MLITRCESLKEISTIVNYWYDHWPETFYNTDVPKIIEKLQALIKERQFILIAAFEGPQIVSSCGLCLQKYEILNLYTIPDYRKQGYATRVLHECIRVANDNRIHILYIRIPSKYVHFILREFESYEDEIDDNGEVIMRIENNPGSPLLRTLRVNV